MASVSDFFSTQQLKSFRESNNKINIWEGAVSSGKTHISLWRFYLECRDGPEGQFVMLAKTYDTFKRNILPELEKILGAHVRYYSGKRLMYVKNRLVHVIGCSDERSEQKIRGLTAAGAYVDEITLVPETAFKMLQSRLRVPGAKLFGTTNPDSPYHWFKTGYLEGNSDVTSFQFKMDDNPYLTSDYKEYIKRQYKGLWYQRYIEGLWVQAEGAIYDFFEDKLHVIDYPKSHATTYLCGIDYGSNNPTSFILVGLNFDKYPRMWVEDEYYYDSKTHQRQKTDAEFADDLRNFLELRNPQAIYIDPSALSFRLELQKQGFSNLYEAKNDVLDGIRLVANFLSTGDLKICRKCKNIIREFQSYVWDAKSLKLGIDKPLKENDHALDALRYVIYSHFFNKSVQRLTPDEIDNLYQQSRSDSPYLPAPFREPREGYNPMGRY